MSKLKVDEIRSADRSVSDSANITLADDGNVTIPNTLNVTGNVLTANRPSFCVCRDANQALTANTEVTMQWNIELHDNPSASGGHFNNTGSTAGGISAYSFKAPVAGIYYFSILTYVYHTNHNFIYFKKDGAKIVQISPSERTTNVNPAYTSGSFVYQLSAGNEISTTISAADDSNLYWGFTDSGNYVRSSVFSGFLVG